MLHKSQLGFDSATELVCGVNNYNSEEIHKTATHPSHIAAARQPSIYREDRLDALAERRLDLSRHL